MFAYFGSVFVDRLLGRLSLSLCVCVCVCVYTRVCVCVCASARVCSHFLFINMAYIMPYVYACGLNR